MEEVILLLMQKVAFWLREVFYNDQDSNMKILCYNVLMEEEELW